MALNEERTRYQNLLTEHIKLEAQYTDLKSEQEAETVRSVYSLTSLKKKIAVSAS